MSVMVHKYFRKRRFIFFSSGMVTKMIVVSGTTPVVRVVILRDHLMPSSVVFILLS